MKQHKTANAFLFYSLLLRLYPTSFANKFYSQMLQTFKDHYIDVYKLEGKVGIMFWFETIIDDLGGMMREQSFTLKKIPAYVITLLLTPVLFLGSILIPPVISLFSIYILEVSLLLVTYFLVKKLPEMKVRTV